MKRVGLVCDLSFARHCMFKNYYYALSYLYNGVHIINTVDDLVGIELLFIVDDHYSEHKRIITLPKFAAKCNERKIQVVVLGTERIFGTAFPWNEFNYSYLANFNKLIHYTYDVDDCKRLGTNLLRLCMSRNFVMPVDVTKKLNKIIFVGSVVGPKETYKARKQFIQDVQEEIDVDVFPPEMDTWQQYIHLIAKYRYVLCPLGNANALALRFYETLLVHSIPLQQVQSNTLEYYDEEAGFGDCIFYETPKELASKLHKYPVQYSTNELWAEDTLRETLQKDGLLC